MILERFHNGVLVETVDVPDEAPPAPTPLETLLTALAEAQTLEEVRLAAAAAAGVTP